MRGVDCGWMCLAVLAGLSACRQLNPDWLGPSGGASTAGTEGTTMLVGSDTSAPDDGVEATITSGSSSGDTGVVQCDPAPVLGAGECPEVCSACDGGRCLIDCTEIECGDEAVACPDGWPCDISCTANSACKDAEIHCASDRDCTVECRGKEACRDANVTCGASTCAVTCGTEKDACRSIDVFCGPADSTITCEESEDVEAHATDSSCACESVDCED